MFTNAPKQHRRLKRLLTETKVLGSPDQRIDIDLLKKQYQQVLNFQTQEGRVNFHKLIAMIFEPHPHQSIRIKLLIVLHYILVRSEDFCQEFQLAKKPQFSNPPPKHKSKLPLKSNLNSNYSSSSGYKTTNTSCRSNGFDDISYSDLSQYLHAHITLPYFSYLMKVSVNTQFYYNCRSKTSLKQNCSFEEVCNLGWKIINMIRGMIVMKRALTNVGRYYLSGSEFILDLIEIIGNDISDLYGELECKLVKRVHEYETMSKGELQSLMAINQEISHLNQQLFVIFYNRYFHKLIKGIEPEKWLTFDNELIEKIHFSYSTRFGGENKVKERVNKTKRQDMRSKEKVQFSLPTTVKNIR